MSMFNIRRKALMMGLLLGLCLLFVVSGTTAVSPPSAQPQTTIILYDGAAGGTPNTQQLYYQTWPLIGAAANQSYADGATTLDTTPNIDEYAGYGTDDLPTLDRAVGYSAEFTIQVLAETHTSDDRAGFGFTILGEDLQGIALNFWQDEVWASEGGSNDLFQHAEGAAFDTTTALIHYKLVVLGNIYTLFANDSQILSGPLRNYTAFEPPPPLPINPYTIPNSLGLGDNTTSASAQVKLSFVGVTADNHNIFLPIITQ